MKTGRPNLVPQSSCFMGASYVILRKWESTPRLAMYVSTTTCCCVLEISRLARLLLRKKMWFNGPTSRSSANFYTSHVCIKETSPRQQRRAHCSVAFSYAFRDINPRTGLSNSMQIVTQKRFRGNITPKGLLLKQTRSNFEVFS